MTSEVCSHNSLRNRFRSAEARTRTGFLSIFAAFLLLFQTALAAATPQPVAVPNPGRQVELNRVIGRYVEAAKRQREAMKGAEMEADINGELPAFSESGNMSVLRKISPEGEISYEPMRDFEGDNRIKKDVIARYLEKEQESHGYGALNITPEDYTFQIKAILREKTRTTYVFDVIPHERKDGAVQGEIWIDGETGMPLRESVELVKSPSFWLTDIRTNRDYTLKNGMSVIQRMENRANIRMLGAGHAEINIDYKNVKLPGQEPATSAKAY